jgi:hypothetical protein
MTPSSESTDWKGLLKAIVVIYGVVLSILGGYAYVNHVFQPNPPWVGTPMAGGVVPANPSH